MAASSTEYARQKRAGTNKKARLDRVRERFADLLADTGLTHREVAERICMAADLDDSLCRVTPQTVGNWRRRKED